MPNLIRSRLYSRPKTDFSDFLIKCIYNTAPPRLVSDKGRPRNARPNLLLMGSPTFCTIDKPLYNEFGQRGKKTRTGNGNILFVPIDGINSRFLRKRCSTSFVSGLSDNSIDMIIIDLTEQVHNNIKYFIINTESRILHKSLIGTFNEGPASKMPTGQFMIVWRGKKATELSRYMDISIVWIDIRRYKPKGEFRKYEFCHTATNSYSMNIRPSIDTIFLLQVAQGGGWAYELCPKGNEIQSTAICVAEHKGMGWHSRPEVESVKYSS